MAEVIADKSYVNTSKDAIDQRIMGRYQNGLGKTWDDPNHMKFYNDGAVNFPSGRHVVHDPAPPLGPAEGRSGFLAVAKSVNQIDLYKDAAAMTKTPVPKPDARRS
jgi:nitrate/nitrite transport system substrate-binding protein